MKLMVFRKENRKRDYPWRSRLWGAGALASICLATASVYHWRDDLRAAARAVGAFVLESDYFSVREIQVRGVERVRGVELIALAGLKRGMNIWTIDLVAIEKVFAKHPWVRRVLVRREFPRRVIIEVEERKPKAVVAIGQLYYVDSDGVIFAPVGRRDKIDLPLITGLSAEQLSAPGRDLSRRLQEALQLGDLMALEAHKLSEIHFAAAQRIVLYTTGYPLAVHMGWGNWSDKLARVKRVLALWKGHEQRLTSLDVSFDGQAVAHIRGVGSKR
jgi:cell division protein FtsQ